MFEVSSLEEPGRRKRHRPEHPGEPRRVVKKPPAIPPNRGQDSATLSGLGEDAIEGCEVAIRAAGTPRLGGQESLQRAVKTACGTERFQGSWGLAEERFGIEFRVDKVEACNAADRLMDGCHVTIIIVFDGYCKQYLRTKLQPVTWLLQSRQRPPVDLNYLGVMNQSTAGTGLSIRGRSRPLATVHNVV